MGTTNHGSKTKKNLAKTAKVLAGALKGVGEMPSMTLPVGQVLAMGLPKSCKGGRIVTDEVLDEEEGTRLLECEKDGCTYALGYNEGPDPFGPQKLIEIRIIGTLN